MSSPFEQILPLFYVMHFGADAMRVPLSQWRVLRLSGYFIREPWWDRSVPRASGATIERTPSDAIAQTFAWYGT